MTRTPKRIIRDRFIRGCIVAIQRSDYSHAAYAMAQALRLTRTMAAQPQPRINSQGVTCS